MKKLFAALLVSLILFSTPVWAKEKTIACPLPKPSEGAASVQGQIDIKNSPYFQHPDFFILRSTSTLTLLPEFQTYQQTSEFSCGAASALMVLNYLGYTAAHENQLETLGKMRPYIGMNTKNLVNMFTKLGFATASSLTNPTPQNYEEFKKFTTRYLQANLPVMVENIDWGGHWRVIIGYDTMGTETLLDDVLILADPYDTADHQQDGYVINNATKFFDMWFDAHMLPHGQQNKQWIVVYPKRQ